MPEGHTLEDGTGKIGSAVARGDAVEARPGPRVRRRSVEEGVVDGTRRHEGRPIRPAWQQRSVTVSPAASTWSSTNASVANQFRFAMDVALASMAIQRRASANAVVMSSVRSMSGSGVTTTAMLHVPATTLMDPAAAPPDPMALAATSKRPPCDRGPRHEAELVRCSRAQRPDDLRARDQRRQLVGERLEPEPVEEPFVVGHVSVQEQARRAHVREVRDRPPGQPVVDEVLAEQDGGDRVERARIVAAQPPEERQRLPGPCPLPGVLEERIGVSLAVPLEDDRVRPGVERLVCRGQGLAACVERIQAVAMPGAADRRDRCTGSPHSPS